MMTGNDEAEITLNGVRYIARRHDSSLQEWQVYRMSTESDGVQIAHIRKDGGDYKPFSVAPAAGGQMTEHDSLEDALKFAAKTF